jgi:monoterpene epsilon-lactone hydrolase
MRDEIAEKVFRDIMRHIPLEGKTAAELRESFETLCKEYDSSQKLVKEKIRIKDVDAYWVYPPGTPEGPVILFFHGGAFILGSTRDHLEVIGRLSRASGIRVLSIDYRLAPEHPFPTPGEDCLEAYLWLTRGGLSPDKICLAGDSAGGTLVLNTLIRLRDMGEKMPAGAYCMSPGTDMNYDSDSIKRNLKTDWLTPDTFAGVSILYLAGADPNLPGASPIHADLKGLPPLLIQAGTAEMLLDDSIKFAKKARKAGVDVTLELADGMFHCWQLFSSKLPQGQEALESAGRFIKHLLVQDQ